MKTLILILAVLISINKVNILSQPTWKVFDPNNISTYIFSDGTFNRNGSQPGFEWPKGSGKHEIFSSGFNVAALYNGSIRMSSAAYVGEYVPGYVADSSGIPVGKTDYRFKIYKVSSGDNSSNPDWANWGQMVPFGAPYVDVNHNNNYEPFIDTPGVKGAAQTLFLCMTDGFPGSHSARNLFGGGTLPLYAEVHLTAWGFNSSPLENVQFLKWEVVNKSHTVWNSTYFSIYCDPDLGYPDDDYIACDSLSSFGFCYNLWADPVLGPVPPTVGIKIIKCASDLLAMTSFDYTSCIDGVVPYCEWAPDSAFGAYNFMKGFKLDGTPWVIPNTSPPKTTKFVFSGNLQIGNGWKESDGRVNNCGGSLIGNIYFPQCGDRRMIINSGADNLNLNPNDIHKVTIAQFIAKGNNILNTFTRMYYQSYIIDSLCINGGIFGVKEISSVIPAHYQLYQNYPNPFNPSTNIKLDISSNGKEQTANVKLIVYDITGKAVETLIDKELKAGSYSADWNASNYATGVYFYSLLIDGNIIDTKKMVFVK